MSRFTPWPSEIRDAIAAEVARGRLKTSEIYARIQDGTLDGLSKAYPGLPARTYYAYLSNARAEQRRESKQTQSGPTLAELVAAEEVREEAA